MLDGHKHRARSRKTKLRGFSGPSYGAKKQNPAAHGCITEIDYCTCGARRETNVNGLHVEVGAWYKEDDQ